jgi:hypothetical protein
MVVAVVGAAARRAVRADPVAPALALAVDARAVLVAVVGAPRVRAVRAPPARVALAGAVVAVTMACAGAVILALAQRAVPARPSGGAGASIVDALPARVVAVVGARALGAGGSGVARIACAGTVEAHAVLGAVAWAALRGALEAAAQGV